MKKLFIIACIFAGLASAPAQDSVQFAANLTLVEPLPQDPERFSGQGLFTLEGNSLRYRIDVAPAGTWDAQIRAFGPLGSILFDLPVSGCEFPHDQFLGSCWFRGTAEVPASWIPDLMASRWYVTATVQGILADASLQGQIQLVPEPSVAVFLVLFASIFVLYRFIRFCSCRGALPDLHRPR